MVFFLAVAEHSGLREALLAPTAAPALPDAGRSFFRAWEEEELRTAWSRASIRRWRQQSVPHSGLREALLAPRVAPALPDAGRSFFRDRDEKELTLSTTTQLAHSRAFSLKST
jgi:hypothetical protein